MKHARPFNCLRSWLWWIFSSDALDASLPERLTLNSTPMTRFIFFPCAKTSRRDGLKECFLNAFPSSSFYELIWKTRNKNKLMRKLTRALWRSKRLRASQKYDESYSAESCGAFRMRDSITRVINSRDTGATFRQVLDAHHVVTYHHHENVGHPISRRFTSCVCVRARTYVTLVDLANSRFREYQVSCAKFVSG